MKGKWWWEGRGRGGVVAGAWDLSWCGREERIVTALIFVDGRVGVLW